MRRSTVFAVLGFGLLVVALWWWRPWQDRAEPPKPASGAPVAAAEPGVRTLKWEDLVPKDWNPDRLLDELDPSNLDDQDPRAIEMFARLQAEWEAAPLVEALDSTLVRLPGFVVALEGTAEGITEFLLVPYFGACIHVPPPPANQIVHVLPRQPLTGLRGSSPVWVSGTLTAKRNQTQFGQVGYRLTGARVEPYYKPRSPASSP